VTQAAPETPDDEGGLVVDMSDVSVDELPQDKLPPDPPDFDDCEEGE
jgi:hypothetical protein